MWQTYWREASICPECGRLPQPYQWDQESGANVGSLLLLVLLALAFVLSPLSLLSSFLFR